VSGGGRRTDSTPRASSTQLADCAPRLGRLGIHVYESEAREVIELRELPGVVPPPQIRFATVAITMAIARVWADHVIPVLAGLEPSAMLM
jgi:hypothetical protein